MKWIDICILAALAGLIALSRLHTYDEPVDWDVATYAVIGHEINNGKSLYADVWDIKPPAVFATYALAERITGYGLGEIYFLSVLAACVTMVGIYFAVGGAMPGLIAAGAFAIVSGDMGLDANRPNTEVFINACLAWAMALSLREKVWPIAIGLLLGLATLYKQVAFAPALAIILICGPGKWRQALMILATIAAVWLVVFGWFFVTSRGEIFAITIFASPRYYGGSVVRNLISAFQPAHLLPRRLYSLLPLAMLSIPAFLKPGRQRALLIASIVGTQLAIALPGQFFAHYYQFWLLPLSVGAGLGARVLLENSQLRLRWLAPAAILCGLVALQVPAYRLPAVKWEEQNYGPWHVTLQPVGKQLDQMLPPGQTFYQWADEPWLYFVSGRRAPAAGIWKMHTVEGPMAEYLTRRTLEQLQASPPPIVVVWENFDPQQDHPIARWIAANYQPLKDNVHRNPLVLLKRRGT